MLLAAEANPPVRWDGELGGWLVSAHDLAEQVLRDPVSFTVHDARFSTARLTGPSMLTLDGTEHARHRAAFAAVFRAGAVRKNLTEAAHVCADRLVRSRAVPGELEVRSELAQPLAVEILRKALGLQAISLIELTQWYAALTAAFEVDTGGGQPSVVARMRQRLATVTRPTGLTLEEFVGNISIMLIGGIETVEGMICHAVEHLCTASPTQDVPVNRDDLPAFIEESLRLKAPAVRLDRYATRAVRLGLVDIAAADLVIVALDAADLDPARFADPLAFDPARADVVKHLAFAVGPHYCLGVHVARLETRAALTAITQHLAGARIDPTRTDPSTGSIFRKPFRLTLLAT